VAELPVDVVTVTSTIPATWAGEVAMQVVIDEQLTAVPVLPPNATVVEPTSKSVPVMLTVVPPPSGPAVGEIAVTVGGTPKVNRSAAEMAEAPTGVVTLTSTVPAACAGEVAVQVVVDEQLTAVPAVPPKSTVVEPAANPVPVMVTLVPPACGPAVGLTAVTEGRRVTVRDVDADGPPLFDTVLPVKTVVVDVPAVSVTVSVAVKGPALV
jgi:hypothetical protein